MSDRTKRQKISTFDTDHEHFGNVPPKRHNTRGVKLELPDSDGSDLEDSFIEAVPKATVKRRLKTAASESAQSELKVIGK